MDIHDIIISKVIVTYYCLQVCSIHGNDDAIAHAQTVCRKLKPRLLLSNCCCVLNQYFSLALSLSLNS